MIKILPCIVLISLFGGLLSCAQPRIDSDPDKQVLEHLEKAGSNLSKSHKIEFYLYFPTEESANRATEDIRKEGCNTEVRRAATGSDWLCFATKEMIPTHTELVRLRKRFNEIVGELKGEYDGWETSVVR